MPLVPNFSSQQSLSNNSIITFSDTSSGSDNTITTRHLTLTLADGTILVPSGTTTQYINWPYVNSSIELNLISKSTVASCVCVWLNGTSPIYTKTILMEWDLYDYLFLFGLLSNQTSQPSIINDTNYYNSSLKMIVNLFNSEQATLLMDDIYSAQSNLDKNFYLMNHQNENF